MKKSERLLIALGLGLAVATGGGAAYAMVMQSMTADQLRASGSVGEQADGYLGIVGSASSEIRASVDAINIARRANYTKLAANRGSTIEEAARSAACEVFSRRVQPGEFYRLPDGVWRKRNGNEPVPLPAYCG